MKTILIHHPFHAAQLAAHFIHANEPLGLFIGSAFFYPIPAPAPDSGACSLSGSNSARTGLCIFWRATEYARCSFVQTHRIPVYSHKTALGMGGTLSLTLHPTQNIGEGGAK